MRGRDREERIQELLDGLLAPAEESAVRALVGSDPEWGRSHREALAVRMLLDTSIDREPPADLAPAVLKAVTTDRVRQAFRFRLPSRVENSLVLAATAALAAAVVGLTRLLGTGDLGWIGRGIVATTNGLVAVVDRAAEFSASVAHFDWIARLLATLSEAARTVLATSAEPLLGLVLFGGLTTVALAVALRKTGRGSREGGWSHAHLLA